MMASLWRPAARSTAAVPSTAGATMSAAGLGELITKGEAWRVAAVVMAGWGTGQGCGVEKTRGMRWWGNSASACLVWGGVASCPTRDAHVRAGRKADRQRLMVVAQAQAPPQACAASHALSIAAGAHHVEDVRHAVQGAGQSLLGADVGILQQRGKGWSLVGE